MFKVDPDNAVVKMCVEGVSHESRGEIDRAAERYRSAWERSADGVERCIAAHYVARCVPDAEERLRWNETALQAALAAGGERVEGFLASLYLNAGKSYEDVGNWTKARGSYDDAQSALSFVVDGPYRDTLAGAISRGQQRVRSAAIE